MCSSQGKDLVLALSLPPSLPDFFPLALAVILKRGHRDRPHLLRCARGAAPGQDARARVSPSPSDAHAQGKPPSLTSLSPSAPPSLYFHPIFATVGFCNAAARSAGWLAPRHKVGDFPWHGLLPRSGPRRRAARRECTAIRRVLDLHRCPGR